nr:immunoglobulin heavy chain junction region [Mus musculus]
CAMWAGDYAMDYW